MKTILKDRKTPFEISAIHDHSVMAFIENVRVVIPIHDSLESKPEYKQYNLMTLLNAVKRGKLIIQINKEYGGTRVEKK